MSGLEGHLFAVEGMAPPTHAGSPEQCPACDWIRLYDMFGAMRDLGQAEAALTRAQAAVARATKGMERLRERLVAPPYRLP